MLDYHSSYLKPIEVAHDVMSNPLLHSCLFNPNEFCLHIPCQIRYLVFSHAILSLKNPSIVCGFSKKPWPFRGTVFVSVLIWPWMALNWQCCFINSAFTDFRSVTTVHCSVYYITAFIIVSLSFEFCIPSLHDSDVTHSLLSMEFRTLTIQKM